MKKRISALFVLVMALALICGSIATVSAATKPSKMTLNVTKKTIYVGTTFKVKVSSVKPAKASKSVTYKTSNKKVATVSSSGVVTGKAAGTATITVTSKSNKNLKKTVKFTVKNSATSTVGNMTGLTYKSDFEIVKDHSDGFIFAKNGTVKKYFFNKTNSTMVVFENMKFDDSAVLRIENTLKLGKDEVGAMPKFSGGKVFECEGCGSCTAFEDASFNGTPYACDKSTVTAGYFDDMNHEPIAEPDKIDAIEIVQYWDGAGYKILVNGLVHVEG